MASVTTSLLDLINANLLQPGTKVMVRDVEGELTPHGTIISTTERGTIEYKTPTAFSKAVTNSTSGGWHQVKLKNSGGSTSLFSVKREFAGFKPQKRAPGHIPGHAPGPSADSISRPIMYTPTSDNSRHNSSHIADEDEDEDHDEVMSGGSEPDSPPTPPPHNSATTPPPPRSTMIAKHTKHSLLPPDHSPPTPKSPAPTSSQAPTQTQSSSHTHTKRAVKVVELLVHVESTDAIPYEVTGPVDGYDSLRQRIALIIPDFPFNQPHEMGVYSEYWEKHAGVAYVKPPRNWIDFPACTTLLLKKIPETIIINNL